MLFSVAVLDEANYGTLTPARATELCATAFSTQNLDLLTIHELNLKYRDIDSPTDVLSFGMDGPYGEMVGEIVVSPEYVASEEAKVEELVVHGALHLAGMDHGEDFAGSEMAVVQEAVLRRAGVR